MYQELSHWGIQVNTQCAGDQVQECSYPAVKLDGSDRFYSGKGNCIALDRTGLNACTGQGQINFIPEFQFGFGEWATFPFDNEVA